MVFMVNQNPFPHNMNNTKEQTMEEQPKYLYLELEVPKQNIKKQEELIVIIDKQDDYKIKFEV